jgi:hypothetical protein
MQGIRKSAETGRRSGERDRYDADPQLLSDDFGHRLELRDDECTLFTSLLDSCENADQSTAAPARPPRPVANPDLFNPGATGLSNPTSSLKSVPIRQVSPATGTGKAGGKWQPMASLEPKAELNDHDPFSLGDSDEEPTEVIKKDVKPPRDSSLPKTEPAIDASAIKSEEKTKVDTVEKP